VSPDPPLPTRTALALLGGWLILGVAYISILPPWEGFDESAHYSYLQQLVDSGRVPQRGNSFISKDVEAYIERAPVPYSFEAARFTYRSFFESPPATIEAGRRAIHGKSAGRRHYLAGTSVNWEQQHPPLAYLALAPVYQATASLSLAGQLWALRLSAYLVGWAALVVAVLACVGASRRDTAERRAIWHWGVLGVGIWPACFPAWFPEMARLGNDAFSALIVSLIWMTAVVHRARLASLKPALILGVLLGLGCLTKAFFVPLAAALVAYQCLGGGDGAKLGRRVAAAALMLASAGIIAGWWYLENWDMYYSLATSRRTDGLISGLSQRFSIAAWIRGHAALVTTVAWPGSWSFARPPYVFFVPLSVLVLVSAGAYPYAARHFRATDVLWLPAWLLAPMLGILSYYVLLRVAFTGEGRLAAGYYLHFLAGPLGCALGVGLAALWRRRASRAFVCGLVGYAVVFAVVVSWAQVLLFAGILTKSPERFYALVSPLSLLLGLPEALRRLDVLAYPRLGLVCWTVGAILMVAGLASAGRDAGRIMRGGSSFLIPVAARPRDRC
jgi:hypothetical protein